MRRIYDPYILKRASDGRIFHISAQMPFEYCVDCFQTEMPFFFVAQLEDGRVAITPNVTFMPWSMYQSGFWPEDLFPSTIEYVTLKNCTYPLILTAHPVANFDKWFNLFTRGIDRFAKQPLGEFVATSRDFFPLEARHDPQFVGKEMINA